MELPVYGGWGRGVESRQQGFLSDLPQQNQCFHFSSIGSSLSAMFLPSQANQCNRGSAIIQIEEGQWGGVSSIHQCHSFNNLKSGHQTHCRNRTSSSLIFALSVFLLTAGFSLLQTSHSLTYFLSNRTFASPHFLITRPTQSLFLYFYIPLGYYSFLFFSRSAWPTVMRTRASISIQKTFSPYDPLASTSSSNAHTNDTANSIDYPPTPNPPSSHSKREREREIARELL